MMVKTFADIQHDTPRLVVMFKRDGENEMFQWGMVGAMPLITLIGYITRVQGELQFRNPEPCNQLALAIVWDQEDREFSWFVHPDIPVNSLIGMLETVKVTLLNSHMARQIGAQQVGLLGPDGRPLRR